MAEIKNVFQTNFSGPLLKTFSNPDFDATTGFNLPLGSIPDEFEAWNVTQMTNPTNGAVFYMKWMSTMATPSAIIAAYNVTLLPLYSFITTNGIKPFTTADGLKWVPNQTPYTTNKGTQLLITGISNAAQAVVTATNSFTAADEGVTWVTFSQVLGMVQINTLRGQVVKANSGATFTVNIDTTNFTAYSGAAGIANVITGAPATTQFGPQIIQTPQRDLGLAGLNLGSAVFAGGADADVWVFTAMWNGPVLG
jgi:hypothetical protein